LLESERQAGERLVRETEHFLAYCPFASRFPYEISIAPKQHASRFESLSLAQLGELAQTLRFVLIALEACIANPAYNYAICNAPFDTGCHPYYHWHIEVFPRLTNLAGFELATGCYINPVSPESAARRLRSVSVNGEEQGNYFDQKN
jgi:UDPglucose--hexose-1-phosphate uridylyltransferase